MMHKMYKLKDLTSIKTKSYLITKTRSHLMIMGESSFVYGLGEKYNGINQKHHIVVNEVFEKFCHQGEKTYYPCPFFILEHGLGVFIHTKDVITFEFKQPIMIDISKLDEHTEIYIFEGSYEDIIRSYNALTETLMPPLWVFGPWISAHRWNSQELILNQLNILKKHQIPVSALVIEQWSDEATFYIFNGASYQIKDTPYRYEDFTFDPHGLWTDPKAMIKALHDENIKVLLWQIPVLKHMESHEKLNPKHENDKSYAVKEDMVVKLDEKPFRIPEGRWFPGSYVPDFTNPKTRDWWMNQRRYLLDIGVDGFKTDGGEFISDEKCSFYDGSTGKQMTNDYSRLYTETYKEKMTDDQVLFSRAGYHGSKKDTIIWAGDQKSTWDELRHVYGAGLSAALSGHALWSFDIGGFAGDMPSYELYVRSTQLAVFVPIMQCHSEPVGGQFAKLDPSKELHNERTPWHIASYHEKMEELPQLINYYYLRMHLLPSIYSWTTQAILDNTTVMKHMMVAFNDEKYAHIDDQHMFGHLLVAPVLNPDQKQREVIFPEGTWIHLLSNEVYQGNQTHTFDVDLYDMLVFMRSGKALITQGDDLLSPIANDLDFKFLTINLYGEQGKDTFMMNQKEVSITWKDQAYQLRNETNIQFKINFK